MDERISTRWLCPECGEMKVVPAGGLRDLVCDDCWNSVTPDTRRGRALKALEKGGEVRARTKPQPPFEVARGD